MLPASPCTSLTLVTAAAAAVLITACGGGSGNNSSNNSSANPAPNAGTNEVTLAGVVSVPSGGVAASRPVTAKCASGTASVTTNADGTYRVTVSAAALPCLLEAVLADGTELHSVATGSGSSATANINPVTELVVANLSGTNTSTYYDNFNRAAAASVTDTAVTNAVTAITPVLTAAGVSTSALGNPVTATVDSGYTTALGSLGTALSTGNTTVADLSRTVANASSQNTSTTAGTASLPAELLVKASASNCASLRAGAYQFIKVAPSATTPRGTDPIITLDTGTFNPTTLTWTWSDGSSDAVTPAGNCHYTIGTANEFAVSPAGVIVGRDNWNVLTNSAGSTYWAIIGLPVQNIAMSELAGNWDAIGWNESPFQGDSVKVTFDNNGTMTSAGCVDQVNAFALTDAQCNTVTALNIRLTANSAGGFNLTSSDPTDLWSERVFAYRAGDGNLMLVDITAFGEITFFTRPTRLAVPAVNDTFSLWTTQIDTTGVSPSALAQSTHTILSVDTGTGAYTRRSGTSGSAVTHVQSLQTNVARNGFSHRTGETVTASDSSPVAIREFYGLSMPSFGITPAVLPASGGAPAAFQISVRQ